MSPLEDWRGGGVQVLPRPAGDSPPQYGLVPGVADFPVDVLEFHAAPGQSPRSDDHLVGQFGLGVLGALLVPSGPSSVPAPVVPIAHVLLVSSVIDVVRTAARRIVAGVTGVIRETSGGKEAGYPGCCDDLAFSGDRVGPPELPVVVGERSTVPGPFPAGVLVINDPDFAPEPGFEIVQSQRAACSQGGPYFGLGRAQSFQLGPEVTDLRLDDAQLLPPGEPRSELPQLSIAIHKTSIAVQNTCGGE